MRGSDQFVLSYYHYNDYYKLYVIREFQIQFVNLKPYHVDFIIQKFTVLSIYRLSIYLSNLLKKGIALTPRTQDVAFTTNNGRNMKLKPRGNSNIKEKSTVRAVCRMFEVEPNARLLERIIAPHNLPHSCTWTNMVIASHILKLHVFDVC